MIQEATAICFGMNQHSSTTHRPLGGCTTCSLPSPCLCDGSRDRASHLGIARRPASPHQSTSTPSLFADRQLPPRCLEPVRSHRQYPPATRAPQQRLARSSSRQATPLATILGIGRIARDFMKKQFGFSLLNPLARLCTFSEV